MKIDSKLPNVGTTIFTKMTNLANEHQAINLSQGFPDFDVDPQLIDLVRKYMKKGVNQYAPMQGALPLREKIIQKIRNAYDITYDVDDEITVTSGATEALFAAIMAVVNKGDEVIIIEPAHDSYVPVIELCGGVPVFVKLNPPEYTLNWDHVWECITDRTRMIILNSPHNPTGAVLRPDDIKVLKQLVEKKDLLILSDEVYEHIIFDGITHESMLAHPDLASNSLVVSSFGKTFHATGWKVGYCVAPKGLTKEFRKIHQYLVFSVNTPVQMAYADFLGNEDHFAGLADFYQQKRDLFLSEMKNSRFKMIPCQGSYFQMVDYSDISDLPDVEFTRQLIMEYKVAAIPPSSFYQQGDDHQMLRFCFAKKDDTLKEAASILCSV